jgi:hypothetical protein
MRSPPGQVEDWLSNDWLRAATPAVVSRQMLAEDAVAALLPAATLERLAGAALEQGVAVGLMLCARYPGCPPEGMAKALGVSVVDADEQPWAGPFFRHADYRSVPPEIRLFRPAIALLDGLLSRSGVGGRLGIACTAPVFVAHELYHHIEATGPEPPLARRHAVTRLRVGRFQLRAPVLVLPEIAAGACAQAMLGLQYHPALLDLVVQWHLAPRRALARAAALGEMGSKSN